MDIQGFRPTLLVKSVYVLNVEQHDVLALR